MIIIAGDIKILYSVKYTESVKRVKSFEALNGVTRLNCAFYAFYALKKCSRTRISILLILLSKNGLFNTYRFFTNSDSFFLALKHSLAFKFYTRSKKK